jgi:superfamily II DNA or RNA helicase
VGVPIARLLVIVLASEPEGHSWARAGVSTTLALVLSGTWVPHWGSVMLFDFFEEDEDLVDVDTATIPPARPQAQSLTFDFDDLDDEAEAIQAIHQAHIVSQVTRFHDRSSFTLRDYQEEAVQACFREWKAGNWSTEIVMATGTGKTVVFGTIAKRYTGQFGLRLDGKPRRGLILAHRGYLLNQAANTLAALGVDCAIEKAEKEARGGLFEEPSVVVATVQSMQGKRLKTWDRDYFDYLVTDEGHHGEAKSYRNVYEYFRPYAEHRVFVTATPREGKGKKRRNRLESLCHSRAFSFSILDAVRRKPPCLCKIKVRYCDTQVDLSQIRTTAGDLNQGDIEEAIAPHIETLARATKKEIEDRKTLVFCPDVGSSQAFASALVGLGINAASLDGKSSEEERERVLEAYRQGEFQVLCNCALFTEGFDVPEVAAVVLCRPTESEALYFQMIGRGTRLKTGKHKDLIIVDFPWVAGKHSLITPLHIFHSTIADDEVYKEALKHLGGTLDSTTNEQDELPLTDDIEEAITMADKVVKERREFAIKARDGRVKYRKMEYDPLGLGDEHNEGDHGIERPITQPPSDKQITFLNRHGVDGVETMSRKRASFLIGLINERRDKGLATFKQVKLLIRLKVPPKAARSMTFQEANEFLNRRFNK